MKPVYLPRVLASRFGDAPAVRDENTEMTFRELDARVTAVACQFREHGVTSGDVIAVMLPNRSELVISIFAAWYLGAAATPINPNFTHDEAEHQIADADATLVVNAGHGSPSGGRPAISVDDLRTSADGTDLEPVDLVVTGDRARLAQVAANLLDDDPRRVEIVVQRAPFAQEFGAEHHVRRV